MGQYFEPKSAALPGCRRADEIFYIHLMSEKIMQFEFIFIIFIFIFVHAVRVEINKYLPKPNGSVLYMNKKKTNGSIIIQSIPTENSR